MPASLLPLARSDVDLYPGIAPVSANNVMTPAAPPSERETSDPQAPPFPWKPAPRVFARALDLNAPDHPSQSAFWWGYDTLPWQRGLALLAHLASWLLLGYVSLQWWQQHTTWTHQMRQVQQTQQQATAAALAKARQSASAALLAASASSNTPAKPARLWTAQDVSQLNKATAHLNAPWTDVLAALERRHTTDVSLLELEPDMATQSLRLVAEAKTIDTLMVYAQQVATDPLFNRLSLVRHETHEQGNVTLARLTFEVELTH